MKLLQFKYKNKIYTVTDDQLKIICRNATASMGLLVKETVRRRSLYLASLLAEGLGIFSLTRCIKALGFSVPPKLDARALWLDITVKGYVMGVSLGSKLDCVIINGEEYYFESAPIGLITTIIGSDQYLVSLASSGLFRDTKTATVVDVGANVGIFSIFAAAQGVKKVIAYEPVPSTVALLQKNISINKKHNLQSKIKVIAKGVSDKKGFLSIYFDGAGDEGASLMPTHQKISKFSKKVPVTTIDADAKIIGPVDLIKIDAEGLEEEIIRGAEATIRKYKPVITMAAYHKPGDVGKLSRLVKSIDSGYLFHVKKNPEMDLVCYHSGNVEQRKTLEKAFLKE